MKREETSPSKPVWFASLRRSDWMKTARLDFYTTLEAKHTETCQLNVTIISLCDYACLVFDKVTVQLYTIHKQRCHVNACNGHFEQTQAKHTRWDKEREGSNIYVASDGSEHRHSGAKAVHQNIIKILSWKYTWQSHIRFNSSACLRNMSSPPSGTRFRRPLVIKRSMILLEIAVEVLNHSIDSNLLNRFSKKIHIGSFRKVIRFHSTFPISVVKMLFKIFESNNRPETECFTFFKTFSFMFTRRISCSFETTEGE